MERSTQEGQSPAQLQREAWGPTVQAASDVPTLRPDSLNQDRMAWLVRTIEADIIPRLMLAHQTRPAALAAVEAQRWSPGSDDVAELARIILDHESSVAQRFVEALRDQGVPLEALYLDLLAPAARRLGEMWEADLCDFTQVTVGLWRLQQVMYELSPEFQSDADYGVDSPHIMLVPVPGSQHTLGLFMVAEFFRRAGWDVWGEPAASVTDLLEAVRSDWFDLIGISIGAAFQMEGLGSVILALRHASRNPDVRVMLGGPVALQHPDMHLRLGADVTAADAPQALALADGLMARRSRRC